MLKSEMYHYVATNQHYINDEDFYTLHADLKGSCHSQLMALTPALSPMSALFIDLPLKPREKSTAIYFPSHIYPLQSLPISLSPWAANYRETPTTSWAVICGAADPHPLDLLSPSPLRQPASLPSILLFNFFFSPTGECQPPFLAFFLSRFSSTFRFSLSPVMIYTLPPQ